MTSNDVKVLEGLAAVAAMVALGGWLFLQHIRQPESLKGYPLEAFGAKAASACAAGADDYLKQSSKFAYRWDQLGFFEQRFDHHLIAVYRPSEPLAPEIPDPGVLILASNKVSLQNQYGAFQRVELHCYYDTKTGQAGYSTAIPP